MVTRHLLEPDVSTSWFRILTFVSKSFNRWHHYSPGRELGYSATRPQLCNSVRVSVTAEWSEKSAKCMLYCALANNNNNHNEVVVETILNK